ncbi:SHOCT domain-containing protein [archaeon]|nr:SHOCT domain-containing protein [archaeon]
MGYGDGWGVFSLLFWILVFIALVLLVYWLYRSITGASGARLASEILKQRYARGELTKKQYEEMRTELE